MGDNAPRAIAKFCLVVCLLVSIVGADDTARGPKRTKVSPYAGITPFLRTGRDRFGQYYPGGDSFDDIGVSRKSKLRTKTFMAFPRVGRIVMGGPIDWLRDDLVRGAYDAGLISKRSESTDSNLNNGLWFGPRLGRLQKRDPFYRAGVSSLRLLGDYTPRLGHDSDEESDLDGRDAEIPQNVPSSDNVPELVAPSSAIEVN